MVDVLHPYSRSERVLLRKKEHTLREASQIFSASHSHACKPQTGTRAHIAAVPIFGPIRIHQAVEEHCNPSFAQTLQHRRVQAWHIDGRARRGSYCAPLMLLMVQTSLVPRRSSNARVSLILIMC